MTDARVPGVTDARRPGGFRSRVNGVVPPVCTPLTPELEVDVPSLARLIDCLLAGGVDGLFFLGSTGEAAYLPDRHRRRVLEVAVAQTAGQVPVLAGAIDMTAHRVLDHVDVAYRAGVDGVVVTAPFYTRTHPAEIDVHFRRVAAGCELPVYAYDLPVSVHTKLAPELVLGLAREGVIAGVKDSSGDDAGLRRLAVAKREAPDLSEFSVLTGSEQTADIAFWMGADGAVPGLANVDPQGYARLYQHCLGGRWDAAAAEQDRLSRLMQITAAGSAARMGRSSSGLGGFKMALHLRGIIDCPVTSPPQIALDAGETQQIRSLLVEAGLL
jgi:4-hydroxy-tetrahydrodipicolinate synthase